MIRESVCIRVPKVDGEKAILLASKLKILSRDLEIQRNQGFIYLPLICPLEGSELSIVRELEAYRAIIGRAVLESHENIRTVLAKAGAIGGDHRLRRFTIVAGQPKTETIHKEYNCKYYVDLAKSYFSPRLSYEHNRVASAVKNGETVVDLFTGVGPFAILTAKTHDDVTVYAIDVNPYAVEFLRKNVRLNRVENRVHPILGDARRVVEERLCGVADRVIMNLPERALQFTEVACKAVKPNGGVVHFYSFVSVSDPLENIKCRFSEAIERSGRKLEKILFSRLVRETAPYEWQGVLDARIS
jgi:tRNA (guanine37-N1)-methyltransferase